MKSLLNRYIYLLLAIFVVAGCAKQKTLSDRELAQIFHDAFLANAYTTTEIMNLDSLKLYEPIFKKYGYTTEDVQYTIGSFSTRKSARLSDVVESAIKMLESEGELLDMEVAILDTLDNIAIRRFTHTIYSDSLVTLYSFRDTADMRIVLEKPEPGEYIIEFKYLVDSLDTTTKGYNTVRWLEMFEEVRKRRTKDDKRDDDSDEPDTEIKLSIKSKSSLNLNRSRVADYNNSITIGEGFERFVLILAQPFKIEEDRTPHITFKNLTIKRVPKVESARDSIYNALLPVRIFSDELLLNR